MDRFKRLNPDSPEGRELIRTLAGLSADDAERLRARGLTERDADFLRGRLALAVELHEMLMPEAHAADGLHRMPAL